MSGGVHVREGGGVFSRPHLVVSLVIIAVGLGLGWGAMGISSEAGYGGIGPNALPWLLAGLLVLCGALLARESFRGGWLGAEELEGEPQTDHTHWPAFLWVSAGLLLNGALIERIGFILSCTLCFVLAAQGLKRAQGDVAWIGLATDVMWGLLISAPVYWLFTKLLAINLPGLTGTGWI